MSRSVATLAMLAVTGCQGADEPGALDHASQPIVGGAVDTADAFPAVVGIEVTRPDGEVDFCSGTVVANRTVLTSGRCVGENIDADAVDGIVVGVGVEFETATKVGVERGYVSHLQFDPSLYTADFRAYLRLDRDPGVEPIAIREFASPEEWGHLHDDPVFLVGYGATDEDPGSHLRRSVQVIVRSARPYSLIAGEISATACQEDSGGAVVDLEGRFNARIRFKAGCARDTTAFHESEDDLAFFVDQFEGPCRVDGVCVTEGCRTPDPDCDPTGCNWNGTCQLDCADPDEDCPVGDFGGGMCSRDSDCELGGCIVDPAFPSYPYCPPEDVCNIYSAPPICPPGMECVLDFESEGGEGSCAWVVTPCDPTHPEPCLDGACVPSDEYPGLHVCEVGGGCAISASPAARRPAAPALFGGALAALAVLMLRRRRRAR